MDPNEYPDRDARREDAAMREQGEGGGRRGNRHHTSRRRKRSRQAGADGDTHDAAAAETRHSGRMQAEMPSGRTPGRRAADDPGAVPLGTDDEAAGTPPRPEAIDRETARAEHAEGREGRAAHDAMTGRPGHPEESPRGFGRFVTIAAAIVIAVIVWIAVT